MSYRKLLTIFAVSIFLIGSLAKPNAFAELVTAYTFESWDE
jgi:hypothetical protein